MECSEANRETGKLAPEREESNPNAEKEVAPPDDDDESTRSSEDGIDESLKQAQRESEKAARKQEIKLRKQAQEEQDRLSREEMLEKLRRTMKQSSVYSEFLFKRLQQSNTEQRSPADKRKRKLPSRAPIETRKRARTSAVLTGSGENTAEAKKTATESVEEAVKENEGFKPPTLFVGGTLRPYQEQGLQWLSSLHYNGINGILADEMGLGKTIQVIAEICRLYEQGIEGPFLIVGPLSTVSNWKSEFTKFAPAIPVIVYHGTPAERAAHQKEMYKRRVIGKESSFPVFITTYEIILRDTKFFQFPKGRSTQDKFAWSYFVIDEGHRMKNYQACLTRTLKQLQLAHRLILTGTPLQNDLSELWSLLNFILPEVFNNRDWFQSFFDFSWIGDEEKAEMEEMGLVKMIHEILNPFLLRRLKIDVELDLPPKREVMVYAPLTPFQQKMYEAAASGKIREYFGLVEGSKKSTIIQSGKRKKMDISYEAYFKDDSYGEDVENLIYEESWKEETKRLRMANENKTYVIPETGQKCLLNLKVMNCRQACLREITMHPYLLCRPVVDSEQGTVEKDPDEDLVKQSGKMMVLDRLLRGLKSRGHKVLLFSQFTGMLDHIQDYCFLRNYQYRRLDGTNDLISRSDGIAEFNTDPEVFIFLISTKAGGLGINLAGADTVIFYDSDWNPQTDLQAQDRCHRIGQTKPVVVYRLTGKGTIDEKIVRRATNKRRLEKMVIFEKSFKGKEHDPKDVDPQELLDLLKSTDYSATLEAAAEGAVISDEDLEKLLNRSDMVKEKFLKQKHKEVCSNVFEVLNEEI